MSQLRIYGASKIMEHEFWRSIRYKFPGVEWTARWPDLCLPATTGKDLNPSPRQAERAWLIDFQDVRNSDAVMVLHSGEDQKLRGALVEAGYALALNKPVLLIGRHPDYDSWQYYPLVKNFSQRVERLGNIRDAIEFLQGIGS